jgi:hypothetical protein
VDGIIVSHIPRTPLCLLHTHTHIQFEADRTKQSLVSGASYTRALLQQSDRTLQDRYCSWVSSAHKELDEELWFDEPIIPKAINNNDGQGVGQCQIHQRKQIIEYKHLFVGGTRYVSVYERVTFIILLLLLLLLLLSTVVARV